MLHMQKGKTLTCWVLINSHFVVNYICKRRKVSYNLMTILCQARSIKFFAYVQQPGSEKIFWSRLPLSFSLLSWIVITVNIFWRKGNAASPGWRSERRKCFLEAARKRGPTLWADGRSSDRGFSFWSVPRSSSIVFKEEFWTYCICLPCISPFLPIY